MRINERDLDPEIRKKLNQFDALKASFDRNNPDGFISFNGEEFYIKRTNNTAMRKAVSEEDILRFRKHMYTEDTLHKNSFMSDFNYMDSNNAALISHVWDINDTPAVTLSDEIHVMKEYNNAYYIFDCSGYLSKIYNDALAYQVNILDILRKNFSLSNFLIFDIINIEPDFGVVYITTSAGVYLFHEEDHAVELKFKKNNVLNIRVLDNNEVFLSTKKGCYLYSSETGLKLESDYQLKHNFQVPVESKKCGDYVFLLSKSLGINNGDRALHCWKKDKAGITYNNIDNSIRANSDDISYVPKHIYVDNNNVYVGGIKNNHFFVWKYDINNLHKPYEEIIFSKFEMSDVSCFSVINNKYLVSTGERIYIFRDDMSILYNFNLKRHIYTFNFKDDIFRVAAGNCFIKFKIPEFERREETLLLRVYDGDVCNNIEIYVKGVRENGESIHFYNEMSMKELTPEYIIYDKDQMITKFTNSNVSKILMRISVRQDSVIESIVVKHNAIFLI